MTREISKDIVAGNVKALAGKEICQGLLQICAAMRLWLLTDAVCAQQILYELDLKLHLRASRHFEIIGNLLKHR